jgi:hypothetical protein
MDEKYSTLSSQPGVCLQHLLCIYCCEGKFSVNSKGLIEKRENLTRLDKKASRFLQRIFFVANFFGKL